MALSVFDLFSIGIGPSSSHTVGPMRAARAFVEGLAADSLLDRTERVCVQLFGSLGATGHGHGSEKAVILGLEGEDPATVDTDACDARVRAIRERGFLNLGGSRWVSFADEDLVLHRRRSLPAHPNGMTFQAFDETGRICERTYYSVGGGFVVDEEAVGAERITQDETQVRYPFTTAAQLLEICAGKRLRISDVMLANELAWRSEREVRAGLLEIWAVMRACVDAGCRHEGVLPGGPEGSPQGAGPAAHPLRPPPGCRPA
jgi:L-serine dehydratase